MKRKTSMAKIAGFAAIVFLLYSLVHLVPKVQAQANLVVVSHSTPGYQPGPMGLPGSLWVYGEVNNTGSVPAMNAYVVATFYNITNEVVTTQNGYCMMGVLLPCRTSPFFVLISDYQGASKVHNYTLSIHWTEYPAGLPQAITILSHTASRETTFGVAIKVAGQIKNVGSGPSNWTRIYATYYNASGVVVYVDSGTVDKEDLSPNEVSDFSFYSTYPTGQNVTNYKLMIQSNQYVATSDEYGTVPPSVGEVSIVTHSIFYDETNNLRLVGEVENTGDIATCDVKIDATFFNASNEIVGQAYTFAELDVLVSGAKSPFETLPLPPSEGSLKVHNYSLTISFNEYPGDKPSKLLFLSSHAYIQAGTQYLSVNGTIKNLGSTMSTQTEVFVTFYNASGVVIGQNSSKVDIPELGPNQESTFHVTLVYSPQAATASTYRLTAQSDQYATVSEEYAVVPEFPSAFSIILLFMTLTMILAAMKKRQR